MKNKTFLCFLSKDRKQGIFLFVKKFSLKEKEDRGIILSEIDYQK